MLTLQIQSGWTFGLFCKIEFVFLIFTLEVTYVRGCTCHVARNFCGSLFLRISDFLCFAELIFAIRTDPFFLLGINFAVFRKYPALRIFSLLLSTYNRNILYIYIYESDKL